MESKMMVDELNHSQNRWVNTAEQFSRIMEFDDNKVWLMSESLSVPDAIDAPDAQLPNIQQSKTVSDGKLDFYPIDAAKMAGEVNDLSKNCGLYPCSSLKSRKIAVPFLPNDIIYKILLYLPADVIYNVMRNVCREWYYMIKDPIFIDAHIKESPACFLVQTDLIRSSPFSVEIGKNGIEITDLSMSKEVLSSFWQSHPQSPTFKNPMFPGRVLTSCRGLVLVFDKYFLNFRLHVANLLTKKWVILPSIKDYWRPDSCAGLAYGVSCKKYKVAYYSGTDNFYGILTIGVDKSWRYISTGKYISDILGKDYLRQNKVYSTGRFMHWPYSTYVLSFDVETEGFHLSVQPKEFLSKCTTTYFSAMKPYLSVILCRRYIWELWALTKVETGGEWTRLLEFSLPAHMPELERCLEFRFRGFSPEPIGFLGENGEIVMCEVYSFITPFVRFAFYSPCQESGGSIACAVGHKGVFQTSFIIYNFILSY